MGVITFWVLVIFGFYIHSHSKRLKRMEGELGSLRESLDKLGKAAPEKPRVMPAAQEEAKPATAPAPEAVPHAPVPEAAPAPAPVPLISAAEASVPPQPEPGLGERLAAAGSRRSEPAVDWERFTGIKLFAWVGGFALFLGAGFFVKYSIDHGLLSPMVRVTLSFLLGGGCIGAGLWLKDGPYAVTARTLCAAGIAILYADIFAAGSVYQFISNGAAFLLMSLVTLASFALAVRMDSKYVAVLGLVGGFLTPPLLSTGVDRPLALFGYVLLLDLAGAATAFATGWGALLPLALTGTALMQAGWFMQFFNADKGQVAAFIVALFALLAEELVRRRPAELQEVPVGRASAAFLVFSVLLGAGMLGDLAQHPAAAFCAMLAANAALAFCAYRTPALGGWHAAGALFVFLTLAGWSVTSIKPELLWQAFLVYLAFAALNAALPVIKWRLSGVKPRGLALAGVYPLLGLAMLLMAMNGQPYVSFFFWPVALLLDVLAVAAGIMGAALWVPVFALALTVGGGFIWLSKISAAAALTGFMAVFALFTIGFLALGVFMVRALAQRAEELTNDDRDFARAMPYLTALTPFLLIVTAVMKLRPDDPSMIFGFGLLMTGVMLAFAAAYRLGGLALPALAGAFVLQAAWHNGCFAPERAGGPLVWYVVYLAAFQAFPVIFRRRFLDDKPAWTAAAAAGPLFFMLIYDLSVRTVGKDMIGLLPAAFAAIYFRLLRDVMKHQSSGEGAQNYRLALAGGMTLFFVTLIFPLQFNKEWLTLAWALEGAALVWLYGRVPHEGLKKWGWALLLISFCRLALNPAVLGYHPRQELPVFNWYLYTYGAAAAAMFGAAALWRPAGEKYYGSGVKSVLMACGAALLFLLLNIEIADYFAQGTALTFQFSGSVPRDMAYTLGWVLFALGLFGFGMERGSAMARKASFGLFAAAILKLFLHDVWSLAQLYRVAAFMITAVILIVVSFLYQKSLPAAKEKI